MKKLFSKITNMFCYGFTLIELLAVIAVLAIILLIAVPRVLDTINITKTKAFERNSEVLISAINTEMARDLTFDPTTLTVDNIDDILGVDNSNYLSVDVSMSGSSVNLHIIGTKSWSGLEVSGVLGAVSASGQSTVFTPDICFTFNAGAITNYDNLNPSCTSSVVIPSKINDISITTIGVNAFNAKGLVSVVLPNTIVTISDGAFYTNSISSIVIPTSVRTIGQNAFRANLLTSAVIKNGVTSLGYASFYSNLLTNVTIPKSVTSIADWVFAGNQISSLTLNQGLITIGSCAFYGDRLTNITIPNTVT